ncbi:selenium-binding protein SBP56-related protein [Actinoplanes sp. TFC3]|uniref:selenium-binding protein SBP56-related protein n=1 Tax=Actinoplanes sp. TFC3 TaxID=1710355 RepID=UPI00191C3773|nr:selenium-binding protein SBP56-related protein [Actinoplanes sp. TFC3]
MVLISGGTAGAVPSGAVERLGNVRSSVVGTDGVTYTAINHTIRYAHSNQAHQWLLVWAGGTASGDTPDPDFLAVVDASATSPSYGKVVNTVTLGPLKGNEPHHMQYTWHQGQSLYAGGILSDTTFVFDTSRLPELRLSGVNTPMDTPCGTAPDAFWVLSDNTAYGTYMGGPNVSGPCRYSNGEVRTGNGFAGTPGEVVRINSSGRTLSETAAALPTPEDAVTCPSVPSLPVPSCANPHGIGVREDLNRMVTSDYVEIRNVVAPTEGSRNPYLSRDTVRIWDIAHRNRPKLLSVSHLPKGPRPPDPDAYSDEQRMVMETALTHERKHRGAFASTMQGGSVFYTPDITAAKPVWREVFDDTAAYRSFQPDGPLSGAFDGGSWLQLSPDDRYLYHAVMGTNGFLPRAEQTGMVYVLDVRKLIGSGAGARCSVDELAEVERGGFEPDCPKLINAVPIRDTTSTAIGVGPHWGALDNFATDARGVIKETRHPDRLAVANYFVAPTGIDGDHRICMLHQGVNGSLSIDQRFRDEFTGQPCLQFNRTTWPHGATGFARPHGVLFAASSPRRH